MPRSCLQTLLDTRLQFFPDAQRAQSQGVETDTKLCRDALAQINLCSFVLGVVLLDHLPRMGRQLVKTLVQAEMCCLLLVAIVDDFHQTRHYRPLQVFVMHVVHDAQKVNRLITDVRRLDINHPARDAVDDLVRQFFRNCAATRRENGDQAPANSFVQNACELGIGIEPGQESIKIFLLERLKLFRRRHDFGARWQAQRDTVFLSYRQKTKAPSPLRSASALEMTVERFDAEGNLFQLPSHIGCSVPSLDLSPPSRSG